MRRWCAFVAGLIVLSGVTSVQAGIPSGDDWFPSVGMYQIEIFDDAFADVMGPHGSFIETINLSSQGTLSQVHRNAQVGTTIDTEIVSLDLFGHGSMAGDVHLRVGTDAGVVAASTGKIENVVLTPGGEFASGDSFFDVFFEIDLLGMGITLYNNAIDNPAVPAHMQALQITSLPPIGSPYTFVPPSGDPVFLYGGIDLSSGLEEPVGVLINASHTPIVPEPASVIVWGFLGAVAVAAGWWRRRRGAP